MNKKLLIKKDRGFTLFIALIVTSILLMVGFSIGNIILKQIQLSTAGRESQIAFYAADSAGECALYLDRKDSDGNSVIDIAFGTSTDLAAVEALSLKCGSGTDGAGAIKVESKIIDGDNATTTFYVDYRDVSGGETGYDSCAKVTVGRSGNNTVIDSRGYNTSYNPDVGSGQCDISNPRTVERGLLLLY